MYYAKRGGGNRYRYFSINMTETALRRLNLENHLRKAIEDGLQPLRQFAGRARADAPAGHVRQRLPALAVNRIAKGVAEAYFAQREALGFPLLPKTDAKAAAE